MTELRELTIVGSGFLWQIFKTAGYDTVASIREITTQDEELTFLRRVQGAIDELRQHESRVAWDRLARKAYNVLLNVRAADVADAFDVPAPFTCPITCTWMIDPVITPCGITYERHVIERWADATGSEPCTRMPLSKDALIANRALKDAIAMYRPLHERISIPTHRGTAILAS